MLLCQLLDKLLILFGLLAAKSMIHMDQADAGFEPRGNGINQESNQGGAVCSPRCRHQYLATVPGGLGPAFEKSLREFRHSRQSKQPGSKREKLMIPASKK